MHVQHYTIDTTSVFCPPLRPPYYLTGTVPDYLIRYPRVHRVRIPIEAIRILCHTHHRDSCGTLEGTSRTSRNEYRTAVPYRCARADFTCLPTRQRVQTPFSAAVSQAAGHLCCTTAARTNVHTRQAPILARASSPRSGVVRVPTRTQLRQCYVSR